MFPGLISQQSNDIQQLLRKVLMVLWMGRQIVFRMEFSHLPRELGHFSIATAFHRTSLPSFVQNLSNTPEVPSFHSSNGSLSYATCLGSMRCRSSMIPCYVFTWFSKILWNVCVNKWLLACMTTPRILTIFRFIWSLCSERIRVSSKILYHDRVPVIHIRHRGPWCSAVIKSPNFFARTGASPVRLFCKETLSFWLATTLRNFGLLGSEFQNSALWILIQLS